MRLVFFNRFYWPEESATAQLLTDLAEGLAARGWLVTVVTSRPRHLSVPKEESRNGVHIVRLAGPRFGRNSLLGRVIDFATFIVLAQFWVLRHSKASDLLVVKTDPPMLGSWLWAAARLKRARLLHWAQDIYPEIAITLARAAGAKALFRLLRPLRNFTWRHSCGCVTLCPDMGAVAGRAGVSPERITVIPNWAPAGLQRAGAADIATWRNSWGLEKAFIVEYSGNLGRVHDLEPVLEVAAQLRTYSEISFVFIGAGARRDALEHRARELRLENVRFIPPQPRDRLSVTLAAGDLHLVTLHAECSGLVFPSKLYGIAAVGGPVLFIGPKGCATSRQLVDYGFGSAFSRDETSAIVREIISLKDDPRKLAVQAEAAQHFGRGEASLAKALERWEALLSRLAKTGPVDPSSSAG